MKGNGWREWKPSLAQSFFILFAILVVYGFMVMLAALYG